MRDSQKNRVYTAENEVGFKCTGDRELPSLWDCRKFIDTVLDNVWVRQDFGEGLCQSLQKEIKILQTKRRSWCIAHGWDRRIEMPARNWAWNKTTLLHELAHIIAYWCFERWAEGNPYVKKTTPHGPEWCWAFLRLLRHCGAPNEWALMQRMFQLHGVRFCQESPLRKAAQKGVG